MPNVTLKRMVYQDHIPFRFRHFGSLVQSLVQGYIFIDTFTFESYAGGTVLYQFVYL